jgi:hypothetical protein
MKHYENFIDGEFARGDREHQRIPSLILQRKKRLQGFRRPLRRKSGAVEIDNIVTSVVGNPASL